MIEIVTDKTSWDSLVNDCDFADFYHYYDYHEVASAADENPILIHYSENGTSIVIPLILRRIPKTTYKDATSVYGYPGPVTKKLPSNYDFGKFQKELNEFFLEQNIISVFSRLNSFLPNQELCLSNLGDIQSLGQVVYIDLTQSLEEQQKYYHSRLKTYINKANTLYSVRDACNQKDVESFVQLYYENMKRVGAKQNYFFDLNYFNALIHSKEFDTDILLALCKETNEIIGGALFIKKNSIIQYHLSGTSGMYMKLNPLKLLIDEMRIRGTSLGYSKLNLGGGVQSKEDSLFYFKSGYSQFYKPFKVWKYIVNKNIYDELVQGKDASAFNYFPYYRYNEQ